MSRTHNVLYGLTFLAVLAGLSLASLPAATGFAAAQGTTLLDGKLALAF